LFIQKIRKKFFELLSSNLFKFTQIYSNQSLNLITIKSIYLYLLIMIRDNESVESRTARLLKSIANRRISLLSFDVSTEAKNVEIS